MIPHKYKFKAEYVATPHEWERCYQILRQSRLESLLGLDLETTGLDPHISQIVTVQIATQDRVWVINPSKLFITPDVEVRFREQLQNVVTSNTLIGHNIAFDLRFLYTHYAITAPHVFDTMVASQLILSGSNQSVSLKGVCEYFLDYEMDKTERLSFLDRNVYIENATYAAIDAAIMFPLYRILIKNLLRFNLMQAAEIEMAAVPAYADMALRGIQLDKTAWLDILHINERDAVQMEKDLVKIIDSPKAVNLNSSKQMCEVLAKRGIVTKSVAAEVVADLAKQHPYDEVLKRMDAYKKKKKVISSYGQNFIDSVNPVTNRIHANFLQIAAVTGRSAARQPALMTLPQGGGMRECFVAGSNRVFVISDYSQYELRALAQITGDKNMIQVYHDKRDLHTETARAIFHTETPTSHERFLAKKTVFGVAYSIGAPRLAEQIDVPEEEAARMLQVFFRTYPDIKKWQRRQRNYVAQHGIIRSCSGRIINAVWDVQGDGHKSQQRAVNMPMQGTNADTLKRVISRLHRELPKGCFLVNAIHDETLVECPTNVAEEIQEMVVDIMAECAEYYIKAVPIQVDSKISPRWVK